MLALTMLLQASQVNTPQHLLEVRGLQFLHHLHCWSAVDVICGIFVVLLICWYTCHRCVQEDIAGGRREGEAGLGPAAQLYLQAAAQGPDEGKEGQREREA